MPFVSGSPSRTLGGLVDRSVVTQLAGGRYRLLETVKLFARRRWGDDGSIACKWLRL